MSRSAPEETFALSWRAMRYPEPVREHRFADGRKWCFDFAWPNEKLAVEIEGGVWNGGRHTRGAGYVADCEKYLRATLLGWTVIRLTPSMIQPETLKEIGALVKTKMGG